MLMGAAQGSIKSVVKNIDDYLLRPLGEGLFRFNMQFDFDPEIKGDLEVKARGTESLMANEVRSQRLTQFMQIAAQPSLAPFTKFQYIIREIAKSLELDPDKVTNNMDEAALQAEIMKGFQQEKPPAAPQEGQPSADPSGAVPAPGEQGFTGNEQQPQPPAQQPQAAGGQPAGVGQIQ